MVPDAISLIDDAGQSTPRHVPPGNVRIWLTGVAGKDLRVEICVDYNPSPEDPADINPGTWISAHPDLINITDDFAGEPLLGNMFIRIQPNGGDMVGVKAYAVRCGGRR